MNEKDMKDVVKKIEDKNSKMEREHLTDDAVKEVAGGEGPETELPEIYD